MAQSDTLTKSTTLVQITDSHLFQAADGCLLGVPTLESLSSVVDHVLAEQNDIALVLGTGDISQDGSAASYQHFLNQMQRIDAPMRWIPGNHDVHNTQAEASTRAEWLEPVFDVDGWRIVLLDSAVDGEVFGQLDKQQLTTLEDALETSGERHVLIALHHHPVDIGSEWMADIGLRNATDLFAVTDRFSSVKAIIWGHIHQEFTHERNGVQLLASPSTSVQFKPRSVDFAVDERAPGYRWFRLFEDGRFESDISRISKNRFIPKQGVSGY